MLQIYGPTLGIYALPSLDDASIWNGIIFVRSGYYKDGKFKFELHLHNFPQQPRIFFISKMQHALVDLTSGEVELNAMLAETWNYSN